MAYKKLKEHPALGDIEKGQKQDKKIELMRV